MINLILKAITISLKREFGDKYEIFAEEKRQGLKEPCFFISCINPTSQLFLGKQYSRKNQFCVQYFPEMEKKKRQECYKVAERLFSCLEYVAINEGNLIRGTQMKHEVVDGILHFFVSYDVFVLKETEDIPVMEELSSKTIMKE